MEAITPVFSALNAMQVIMLACISLSVQFADAMWETGLEHIDKAGAALSRSESAVAGSASQVLPVLIEHHVLKHYFQNIEMCVVATQSRKREEGSHHTFRAAVSDELPEPVRGRRLRHDPEPSPRFRGLRHMVTISTPV